MFSGNKVTAPPILTSPPPQSPKVPLRLWWLVYYESGYSKVIFSFLIQATGKMMQWNDYISNNTWSSERRAKNAGGLNRICLDFAPD